MSKEVLDNKINHAVATVEAFSALLEKEAAALSVSNYKEFESLQEPKKQLAHAYQDAVLAFEEHVEELPKLDEKRKDILKRAHAQFREAVKTNEEALMAAKKVSERIVNLIMTAARQTAMDGPAYNAAGSQAMSHKIPVHFRLNEKF